MALEGTAGSPWAEMLTGASAVHQEAIDRLEVPALILELPSRRIHAANRAIAALFGVPVAEMLGRRVDEVVHFDMVEGMERAIEALVAGDIDAYRAHRRITPNHRTTVEVLVWCRLIDFDDARYAAYMVSPVSPAPGDPRVAPPTAWAGPLVVGKAQADGSVGCISSDVHELLGGEPSEYLHRSLLDMVHPDDAARLVEATPRAQSERGLITMRHVRMLRRDGQWEAVQCLLVSLDDATHPDSFAFAIFPEPAPVTAPPSDRVAEMERRLRRIAAELRAAGMMDDLESLPTVEEFPELALLTSRQWHILVRLLRGERVPAIAGDLHVSPSTLRNQLSTMFVQFGVHSQAELIARLRGR